MEKRQKSRVLKPIVEFSHDGDQYKVSGSAEGIPERSKLFHLDVQQEETTIDGRKVKVICFTKKYLLDKFVVKKILLLHRAHTSATENRCSNTRSKRMASWWSMSVKLRATRCTWYDLLIFKN